MKQLITAAQESVCGTNRARRAGLTMSVDRDIPEVAGPLSEGRE
jgi:hypothetical protein